MVIPICLPEKYIDTIFYILLRRQLFITYKTTTITSQSKQTLEKTEGTVKDGQSRDIVNIEHKIKNEDKQNKNTTQKQRKMNNPDPIKTTGETLVLVKGKTIIITFISMFWQFFLFE